MRERRGSKVPPSSNTAGLIALHLLLGVGNRSIREIGAGAAYKDSEKREQDRRVRAQGT